MKILLAILLCCISGKNLRAQIYFDTTTSKYHYEGNENATVFSKFNKLSTLFTGDFLTYKLSGPDSTLVVSDSGKVLYFGSLNIEKVFKLSNNTYTAIVKNHQYCNLLDFEKNELLEPSNSYTAFSILTGKNRICLINEENKRVLLIDLELGKRINFATTGKPLSVHTDFLTSSDICYYQSAYPYRGIIDLKRNKEIIYDKIIDVIQINEKEVLIQKADKQFFFYDVENAKLKKLNIDSFALVPGDNSKYVVKRKGEVFLVNKFLEEISSIKNFQRINFISDDCYLIRKNNVWQFINSKGERNKSSSLLESDIFSVKKTLWVRSKAQGTLKGIFPQSIKNIIIDAEKIEDINMMDSIIIARNGKQLTIYKISGNQIQSLSSSSDIDNIYFTKNSEILMFEKKSKGGLINIYGNVILRPEFDVVISLNSFIFSVFSDNISNAYLVDYTGKEYLK